MKELARTERDAPLRQDGRTEENSTISHSAAVEDRTCLRMSSGFQSGVPATVPITASDESLARRSGVRILLAAIEYHENEASRLRRILARMA